MKRWLRRILIAAAGVALTLGILYECATHVGRGWLFGEAFYEGRPTSWWKWRIDQWKSQYDSDEAALDAMDHWQLRNVIIYYQSALALRAQLRKARAQPDWWQRAKSWIMPKDDRHGEVPKILLRSTEADAVLDQLADDPVYRPFVERRRANPVREFFIER